MKDWWKHYKPGPDGNEPYPNAPVPDLDQLDMVEAYLTPQSTSCWDIASTLGWGWKATDYWLRELQAAGRAGRGCRTLDAPNGTQGWIRV